MLEAMDEALSSDTQQGLDFFDERVDERYAMCKNHYHNREDKANTGLTTLEEAYERATSYVMPRRARYF